MDKLYNYYLWYNHHEGLWYAIPRGKETQFHNGTLDPKEYIKSKNIEDIIHYIQKT